MFLPWDMSDNVKKEPVSPIKPTPTTNFKPKWNNRNNNNNNNNNRRNNRPFQHPYTFNNNTANTNLGRRIKEAQNGEFECDWCSKSFYTFDDLEEHNKTHVKCDFPGCPYEGQPKLVDQHNRIQHRRGVPTVSWEKEESIEKYREERRKKLIKIMQDAPRKIAEDVQPKTTNDNSEKSYVTIANKKPVVKRENPRRRPKRKFVPSNEHRSQLPFHLPEKILSLPVERSVEPPVKKAKNSETSGDLEDDCVWELEEDSKQNVSKSRSTNEEEDESSSSEVESETITIKDKKVSSEEEASSSEEETSSSEEASSSEEETSSSDKEEELTEDLKEKSFEPAIKLTLPSIFQGQAESDSDEAPPEEVSAKAPIKIQGALGSLMADYETSSDEEKQELKSPVISQNEKKSQRKKRVKRKPKDPSTTSSVQQDTSTVPKQRTNKKSNRQGTQRKPLLLLGETDDPELIDLIWTCLEHLVEKNFYIP